jgi:acetoin utilization deacetylase AcuC-like enzyme
VFDEVVWPAAERFEPQLLLASVGFDAYWADPLAGMRLSLSGYSHLAAEVLRMAQRLCEGRVVFVLEGGYHPDALRYGASNVARLLVGDQPDDSQSQPAKQRPDPDVADLIASIKKLHRI